MLVAENLEFIDGGRVSHLEVSPSGTFNVNHVSARASVEPKIYKLIPEVAFVKFGVVVALKQKPV